jgi:uncharacterized protein YgiM (DUF1202 family)
MKAKSVLSLFLLAVLLFSAAATQASRSVDYSEQQSQFALPLLVVNTPFLNIRTGPGGEYTVLAVARGGTELPVLGVARDRLWYLVSTAVGNGWVNSSFTLPRGDFRNVPLIDTSNIQAPLVVQGAPATLGLAGQGGGAVPPGQGGGAAPVQSGGIVITNPVTGQPATVAFAGERIRARLNVPSVNLRSAPTEDSATLAVLFADDTLDYAIVGKATDRRGVVWIAIVVPNAGTGWIEEAKTRTALSALYRTVMVVIATPGVVTTSPGGDRGDLPFLNPGDEVFLLNISADGNFVQIEYPDGKVGWMPFNSVRQRTGTPTDDLVNQTGFVPQSSTTTAASTDLGQGGGGTTTVTGVSIPVQQAGLQLPIAIVNTPFLNVRSGPGAQYVPVATLPGGTELSVIGIAPDEVWWLVQGAFGQGWVNEEFVLFRGNLSNVPLVRFEEVAGSIARPLAVVASAVSLRVAPRQDSLLIGTLVGPAELPVVARTPDFNWFQVETSIGFGWLPASEVLIRGDGNLIPIVN